MAETSYAEPVNLDFSDRSFVDLGAEVTDGVAAVSLVLEVDDNRALAHARLSPAEAHELADALREAADKAMRLSA